MPDGELLVYLDGVRAEMIQQTGQGNTTLACHDDYRRHPDARTLSLATPPTQGAIRLAPVA